MSRSQFIEDQALDGDFVSHIEMDTVSGTLQERIDSKTDGKNKYIEINRTEGKVTSINVWEDNSKVKQISMFNINRISGKVTSTVKNIYDFETGTYIETTISGFINRVGGRVSTIEYISEEF